MNLVLQNISVRTRTQKQLQSLKRRTYQECVVGLLYEKNSIKWAKTVENHEVVNLYLDLV